MRIRFKSYPIDIILLMTWSILILPIIYLNINEILRIVFGLPFLLFIPGYMLIFILFPLNTENSKITRLERIGLSFGFSIAIVALLGIFLNITPWGIQLTTVLFSLLILIESLGIIALTRWILLPPEKRFTISINISQFKASSRIEKILTVFMILSMFLALSSIVYIIVQPKPGDTFTDFYVLTQSGEPVNFPRDISKGQNISLILGIINHEAIRINYTIEVWLVDESQEYNSTTRENESHYNHAWFLDEINVALNSTKITNKNDQIQRWEHNYTFTINKIGFFKLAFLLYTTPSETYDHTQDYLSSIQQKINNAYRELHLWLYVG
jgi:uncharacterized membrane protein